MLSCLWSTSSLSGSRCEPLSQATHPTLPASRIGLLLVADPSSDWYDVSAAMVRGFAFLHQHQSPRKALDWLHLVHNLTAPTTADVIGVFRAQYGDKLNEAVEDIFSEQSEYDSLRKVMLTFACLLPHPYPFPCLPLLPSLLPSPPSPHLPPPFSSNHSSSSSPKDLMLSPKSFLMEYSWISLRYCHVTSPDPRAYGSFHDRTWRWL